MPPSRSTAIRLALALLFAAVLGGCAALGPADDPHQPIPPARASPFSDGATSGGMQY